MTANLQTLGENLRSGWPDSATFAKIPFGQKLQELGDSKEHGKHVRAVLDNMNHLLSTTPVQALVDHDHPLSDEALSTFLDVWRNIKGKDGIFNLKFQR